MGKSEYEVIADWSCRALKAEAKLVQQATALRDCIHALEATAEEIDGMVDVQDDSDGPQPNRWMSLAMQVGAALERAQSVLK